MKNKLIFSLVIIVLTLTLLTLPSANAAIPAIPQFGLTKNDFKRISTGGFGDSANSYSWGLAYYQGALYVGTNRHHLWSVLQMYQLMGLPIPIDSLNMADPPKNPVGTIEWANEMRAEIWRYRGGQWELVHQSDIMHWVPPPNVPSPPEGYYPISYGYRMMGIFNGKLYVCGIGTWWPPMPFSRVITSATGDWGSWQDITGPTLMGTNNVRGLVEYKGKLYVSASKPGASVTGAGVGAVFCSSDPGVIPWAQVCEDGFGNENNTEVPYLIVFNDYLYASTLNYEQGFEVWKTDGSDPDLDGVYDWKQVISSGFGDTWNQWGMTMEVFNDHLYVGTAVGGGMVIKNNQIVGTRPIDLIRVDKDDNAELVMGAYIPRDPPQGWPTYRTPLSKWPAGFGNPLNVYVWHMEVHNGVLYVGTFDACGFIKYVPNLVESLLTPEGIERFKQEMNNPEFQLILQQHPEYAAKINELLQKLGTVDVNSLIAFIVEKFGGADLWKTNDGIQWAPVTLNGFDNPNNYGIRRLLSVCKTWLFVGTANPFTGRPNGGCEVLSGSKATTLFADGFESGNFYKWSGTSVTSGETACVTSATSQSGKYSARFTSNGGGGYEKAYSYKYIPGTTSLAVNAYFKITSSGVYQEGDYLALITLSTKGSTVAYAGWKRAFGGKRWFLTVRSGNNLQTAYSSTQPAMWRWYNVYIRWIGCDKEGSAELWVDGKLVCSVYGLNTISYGPVNCVRVGLPLLYSCGVTKVYADSCIIRSYS